MNTAGRLVYTPAEVGAKGILSSNGVSGLSEGEWILPDDVKKGFDSELFDVLGSKTLNTLKKYLLRVFEK